MIGSGRSTHSLGRAGAVASRDHAVRLVTLGEVLADPPVEVRTQPVPHSLAAAVAAARRFRSDVRSFQPDLVHLHYAGGRLGTMATLVGDYPLAVTVMGGDVLHEQHEQPLSGLERRATRRILERADVLFAKSDALGEAIPTRSGSHGPVVTVRWGIDTATYKPDAAAANRWRERLALDTGRRVILSPRILRPLYNIDRIVEAMGEVRRHCPAAILLITEYQADAAYRESLVELILKKGLAEHTRFVGVVAPREMPGLYTLAELVVSVPRSDGLPQSLFEAMACATPVLLANLPAYREVVEGRESALFAEPNPASLAAAIVETLGDRDMAERLGRRARARVEQVASLPRQLDIVEREYRRIVRAPRRRRPWQAGAVLLDVASLALRRQGPA